MARWWLGIFGCSSTDVPSTAPSDTPPRDVEPDVDTDADADADTGDPPDTRTLTGRVDFERTRDSRPDCRAAIDLVGAAYVGDCPGCEFAFDIDASTEEDCALPPWLSFVDDPVYFDTKLAFSPRAETTSGEELFDVLLFGTSYDLTSYGGQGIYPGPYWLALRSDGDRDRFSFDGTELSWSWPESYDIGSGQTPYGFYDPLSCPNPYTDAEYGPGQLVAGAAGAGGEVDCHGLYTDVYGFEALAGDPIAISVDTVAAGTAFDPMFYVSGPDGCAVAGADENVGCSHPPPTGFLCPSTSFEAPVDGTYSVAVLAYTFGAGDASSCAGSSGVYDLQIDGPNVGSLVPLGDDLPFYEEISHIELEYTLSATLLP